MAHLDEETLALIALGEDGPGTGHLDTCEACRREVAALRRVVSVGRDSPDTRDLPPPPDTVWAAIAAAVAAAPPAGAPAASDAASDGAADAGPRGADRNRAGTRRRPGPIDRWGARSGNGHRPDNRPVGRREGRTRRWARLAATAVVALALGIAGTLVATRQDRATTTAQCGRVVYRADLAALPLAPSGATGEARVLCDGADRRLHLRVTGLPLQPGYYEVWLIDPDSSEMTAVGQLGDDGDVRLPLASTTDLRKYRLVDISAEQYDNNQAHSGDSLLRGQLTT